jgi:hypothetical protein
LSWRHLFAALRPYFRLREWKRRTEPAATAQSAVASHRWVSDCAGHLGGCLLACAPDLFVLAFEIACMNLPFFLLLRAVSTLRSISFADEQGMPREFLPINSFFGELLPCFT